MTTKDDEFDYDAPKAPRLYGFLNVAFYIWTALMVFGLILVVGTGLDNFLHAPIGIKDNPPPPSALVAFAQDLLTPIIVIWVALRVLRWISKEFGVVGVAGTVAWVVVVAVMASAFLARSRWHYEFIPGSVWLFTKGSWLFAFLLGLGVTVVDGYFSWSFIKKLTIDKSFRKPHWFAAGTGFTASTILFVAAFIFHFLSNGDRAESLAVCGVIIGIVGLCFVPKSDKEGESVESLDKAK